MGLDRHTKQAIAVRLRRVLTRCASLGIVLILPFAGCGGQVVDPENETEEPTGDAGDDTEGGPGGKPLFSGSCVKCEDLYECGFCLIQIYQTTYVCPPGKSSPQPACWSLGESHTTVAGEAFTCYYCDG